MILLCLVVYLVSDGEAATSQVTIPGVGPIIGLVQQTPDTGVPYYQYLGVPYGKAGRFEVAQPADPWTTPYNSTVEGKVCPQILGQVQFPFGIGEDCLLLSVTTPVNPNGNITNSLSVLVFFYGGAFNFGTSRKEFYDPEFLVQEGVVIVQPNYRLGSFGWITDDNLIPKNIALKDARAALIWVQKYIQYFGGDASSVTIYGESAGSVLVSCLWHSWERLPANLFRAVFMQSAVVITPWALQKDTRAAYMNVLTKTRCITTLGQSAALQVACLKSLHYEELSVEDLATVGTNDVADVLTDAFNAAVVMEDPSDADAILVKKPLEQLQNGDICTDKPLMISNTNCEMYTFGLYVATFGTKGNKQVVPGGMQPTDPDAVGRRIKSHYADLFLPWSLQPTTTYIEFANDVSMYFPTRYFIELVRPKLAQTAPMFLLEFSYVSPMGRLNDGRSNVGHADDLFYSWKVEFISREDEVQKVLPYPPETFLKRKQFNRMICNFVKYNNPTPVNDPLLNNLHWPEVTDTTTVEYLNFDSDMTIKQRLEDTNFAFWRDLYKEVATGTISL